MRKFTKAYAKKILSNEIGVNTLLKQYPAYKEDVLKEISLLKKNHKDSLAQTILLKYTASGKMAKDKICKSNYNQTTINTFLPMIIQARFAIYLLEQVSLTVASQSPEKGVGRKGAQLYFWERLILQKLLFERGFDRKPVSVGSFNFFWRLIINKKSLMPLLSQKGIYCFFSKELIKELSEMIADQKCLEIGAGDGTLAKFLKGQGISCIATDDYSWGSYIQYPDFVERADAKDALRRYSPEVVLCSWPVPGNSYEKNIFKTSSVKMYIVIGSKDRKNTGNHVTYEQVKDFTVERSEKLSSLVIPTSGENAVYIFRRKWIEREAG